MMMSPRLNGLRPTSSGRTSIVPSPRPCEITGIPPRNSRAGTILARSETSSTRDAIAPASMMRPTSPSAERTGIPTWTPSLVPADRMAKRRGLLNDEPTIRPDGDGLQLVLAKLKYRLELRFSWKIACASTIRRSIAVRSRLSSPFWLAASQ